MGNEGLSGQSAIEYLMTYGWMLLVVAVVGGAIFAAVNQEAVDSVSGFTGTDVIVEDFGVTQDDELGLEMRSGTSSPVEIDSINVTDEDTGEYVFKEFDGERIGVGSEEILSLPNITRGSGSNNLDVEIIYDSGELENLQVSGSISGSLDIVETAEVQQMTEFAVSDADWGDGSKQNLSVSSPLELNITDLDPNQESIYNDLEGSAKELAVYDSSVIHSPVENNVSRVDSEGNEIWTYTEFPGDGDSIAIDKDGYIYVSGENNEELHRITPNGEQDWVYDHPSRGYDIAFDEDENVYVTASFSEEVHKVDKEQGTEIDVFSFSDTVQAITLDDENNLYAMLRNDSVEKVDQSGNTQWVYQDFDKYGNHIFYSSENIYMTVQEDGGNDVHLRKLEKDKTVVWDYLTEFGSFSSDLKLEGSEMLASHINTDELFKIKDEEDVVWESENSEGWRSAIRADEEIIYGSGDDETLYRIEEDEIYETAGEYLSKSFDGGSTIEWSEAASDFELNDGSVELKIEASDNDMDLSDDFGSVGETQSFSLGEDNLEDLDIDGQFVRFKLDYSLPTEDQETPQINSVSIKGLE